MNKCLSSVHLTAICFLPFHMASAQTELPSRQEQDLLRAARIENPHWKGKQLQVAVGQAIEKEQQMAVPFAVLNSSARTIEVLSPEVQLGCLLAGKPL